MIARLVASFLCFIAALGPAPAQNVPYFPQVVPSGTILGRLTTGAGPVEAIPQALWLRYLTYGSFTQGSVVFAGANGILSQDNAYLYWDDTNNRFGLGTTSPSTTLHVVGNSTLAGTVSISGAATFGSTLALSGSSSGVVTLATQAAAGTYNWNYPVTAGSANQVLTSAGGGSSAMTWTSPSNLVGTATNDNASAGSIGEVITSSVASGSAVSLTTATSANVTSVSLTAGDWTVCGNVLFTLGGTTTTTVSQAAFSSTSATLPTAPAGGWSEWRNGGATWTGNLPSRDVACHRASVASTTTYYLVVNNTFATSTTAAYGSIYARRER